MPWNAAELIRASLTCAQILFAVLLFSSSLPVRDRLAGRVVIVGVIFVAWAAGMSLLVPGSLPGSGGNSSTLVVIFGLSLVAALFTVVFVFQASIWTGFFCATAGYTLQNLTGSLWRLANYALPLSDMGFNLGMVIPYLMVYLVAYLSFISRIRRKGLDLIEQRVMLAMMVVVIFAIIGYDVVVKELEAMELPHSMVLACRLAHVLLCLGVLIFEYEVLYSRQLELEVASVEQIMRQEKEQFQISRETIEAINLKCHDIKHQIRSVGVDSSVDPAVLREMEQQVDIYDAAVRTGNEALDVILTEKSLMCERENVTLSCIADGDCIAFMAASDVYSLMGNALDNALEAARRMKDPERRSISLVLRARASMAVLHIENYYAGELRFGHGEDLPATTKADAASHGYGMKSMQLVAKKYHGNIHARAADGVFHLNVVLPLPTQPIGVNQSGASTD